MFYSAFATFLAAMTMLPMMEARSAGMDDSGVDPAVVGRWSCGETVIALGPEGIELSGEVARKGRISASEGHLVILWDGGDESEWAYVAGEGALVLGTDRGANYACLSGK